MTTKEEISQWFDYGVAEKGTHMIVACDTYDWEDFPVIVREGENFWERYALYDGVNMHKVMEVYDLRADKAEQLAEHRCRRTPERT